MSQEQPATKPKNRIGLIMLLSALLLGVSLFVLTQTANNGAIKTTNPSEKVKEPTSEAKQKTKTDSGYAKIEETTDTPTEINNEVLDTLDNDMKALENTLDNVSDLDLK